MLLALLLACSGAADWPAGTEPALDGPLEGLSFGMGVEQAWAATPALRDAFDLRLEESVYADVATRIPELQRSTGMGGNRWVRRTSRRGTWPTVAGAKWELRFDELAGLKMISAEYGSEADLRAAVAAWGPPDTDARWDFWYDEAAGIRGAFTGCHADSVDGVPGPEKCHLELMPFRPVETLIAEELFPGGKTLVGTPEREAPWPKGLALKDERQVVLKPTRAGLWILLEAQVDEAGAVRAYRLPLEYTYDRSEKKRIEAALAPVLGPGTPAEGCLAHTVDGVPVTVCDRRSTVELRVGDWR